METEAGTVKKHPLRGGIWGLIAGIGIALLLIAYGTIALGTLTPYLVVLLVTAVGVVFGSFGPVKGGRDGAPAAQDG